MNGVEQRQRHLAVASAEARIDQLEEVTFGLAETIVADRAGYAKALTDALRNDREQRAALRIADRNELERFKGMTFRQRLRWLFWGA